MLDTIKMPDLAKELAVSKTDVLIILLLFSCGVVAYIINIYDPAFEPLFLALVFGIIAGNIQDDEKKKSTAEKSLAVLLPVGITLYGLNINIPYLGEFKPEVVVATLFVASIIFISIIWLSKLLRINKQFSLLLACGSSICGVSAIAIISPLLKPRKEDFSAAIMIITAVGLTGAIIYPGIAHFTGITPEDYAVLAGATLHQTGLVKISSQFLGVENEALAVKGIRIAMIALVALILSIMYSESRFYVPWYVVSFLGVALFATTYLPSEIVETLRPVATVVFSTTLAAIGYTVNLRRVQRVGIRPLLVAYGGWGIGVAVLGLLMGSGVV
ncbi:YeiH family putative sulfate export transporter [Archaeoglobus neptunius]|uniref:YeiH family putative sulfate export transporter n=1 Tax=Archaeoglobus neptunius TaxID=2798580 RepID=UPI001E4ADE45|nr:YeiH family putative sulfate export transporter [Archaeoglobus neptunius]